jgi:CheY-like chemotaxis protein/HPt (histidine-containing phosphotransfer) domain-containing protein
MNAIIGMSEILESESLNDRQMSYIRDIGTSAQSLLGIINDILDMSKIESGKLELCPVDFCLLQMLDNVASMFRFIANKKEIEFVFECAENVPHYIHADDIRLKQVLVNICGNAIKFTRKGYVKLSVRKAGKNLVIEVSDSGIGIRKESIPKLFNAYEQTDKIKNRDVVGTGLGLSISKSFIEMMGGEIDVESEYGHGSVFTITIPFVRVKVAQKPKPSDKIGSVSKIKKSLSAPDAKVLVTDDNEFNLKVSRGLLSLMDINADTADSGQAAIDLVKAVDYDVVFMDHMMPDMDGIETVAKIRALGGKFTKLPIIALTANAVFGAKEMFFRNGFNDFISKPINSDELSRLLQEWLPHDKVSLVVKDDKEPKPAAAEPELVRFFNARLIGECEKMTTLLRKGNIAGFAIAIHAMKSSLAIIGESALSSVAGELEASAKKDELRHCRGYFAKFEVRLRELHERLNVVHPPPTAPDDSGAKLQGESTTLAKLVKDAISAANDFDSDAATEHIKALLEFDFGAAVTTSLNAALTAFEDFDFDTAIEILKNIGGKKS